MKLDSGPGLSIFEYQPAAVLNQAAPVNGTYYEVGGTGFWADIRNVICYGISINVEDANETLQVRLTLDGEVIESIESAVNHSTNIRMIFYPQAITRLAELFTTTLNVNLPAVGFPLFAKELMVEVRKTTAAGVGNLTSAVMYGVKQQV